MDLIVKSYDELEKDELYEILRARAAIFIVEQDCPYQDLDGRDRLAYHVYLKDDDGIAAYLRVLPRGVAYEDVSIGRVITVRRGEGFGTVLMTAGIEVAVRKFGAEKIVISAQKYATGFYEKSGFEQVSDEYLEDGIVHVRMQLCLSK